MRNFSKTLISMAAVMAVGSAMAAGAMAAELTNINYADGKVTFGGVTPGMSQYTLLVVAKDGNGEFVATEDTIKQIDQDDNGEAFAEAVVGELEKGEYKIMVGNNIGEVDSGILTVGSAVEPTDILVGDINADTGVNASDVSALAKWAARRRGEQYDNETVGMKYTIKDTTDTITIGDTNRDTGVNASDVSALAKWAARRRGEQYDNATVGTTVKGYIVE